MRCRLAAREPTSEQSALVAKPLYSLVAPVTAARQIEDNLRKGSALWQLSKRAYLYHGDPDEMIIPELHLQAAGEAFTLTILVSWILTAIWNPGIIDRNLLKDLVGYNNVCVGFDSPPARYVAVPFFTLVSFLAIRYVRLDSLRAQLQIIDEDDSFKIAAWQYWCTRVCNGLYACFMCCLSILLVVTPEVERGFHALGYVAIIVFNWLVIVANYLEAKEVATGSKIWMALFSLFSVAIPLMGNLDFKGYDQAACERVACPPPKRMFLLHPAVAPDAACPVAAILSQRARAACEQTPTVPVWLLATCDYGFVATLALTVVFLPRAPPVHVDYELRPIAHNTEEVAAAVRSERRARLAQKAVRKFISNHERQLASKRTQGSERA
jgi:hypothetical protein